MSEATGSALARALAKAQAVMEGASKDKTNPAFKSRYADLASVWDACRGPLTSNGLAVVQLVTSADKTSVTVETRLLHEGGESLSSTLTLPVEKATAQGVGSAITYARRYGLSAMVGVAPDDDDDGNEASKPARPYTPPQVSAPPKSAPPSPPSNVVSLNGPPSSFEVRINEAASVQALAELGSELQKQPEAVRNAMRPAYTRRFTELSAKVGR
jgi:hypothetical protein